MQKTAIVVGRFQLPTPHEGHRELINHAIKNSDKLVVVIGDVDSMFTDKNPLPYEIRHNAIKALYPNAEVRRILDHPRDDEWSENLDKIVSQYENPTLYGSRDSFALVYTGKYPVEIIDTKSTVSSTDIRKQIGQLLPSPEGIIYVTQKRFPIVYPTVDIAILSTDGDKFLLGRKKGHKEWRFIGGFVDPTDQTIKDAAERELSEEVKNIKLIVGLDFITTTLIDDWRYRGTKDAIMTSFFIGTIEGNPQPADDIAEVAWFSINDFDLSLLGQAHHILYGLMKNYLKQ